jgi:riboflavin kinase / FMN adenylyltransferase
MEIVRLGAPLRPQRASPAVAIGNFDGVHLGHQALVGAAVADARADAGTPMVLTFDPHPARVIAPERAPRTLLTLEQRAEVLAELGIDVVAVLDFDAALAALSPEEFVGEVLVRRLGAKVVVVGERFRFGHARAGDAALLARLGAASGFRVHALPVVLQDGQPVSSSRIRAALAEGDVVAAARLLGRPFFIDGRVVRGDGRGRQIGVPTANLESLNESLPANGVYAAWARTAKDAKHWPAVVNLGQRPTFEGRGGSLEAHLLGFLGDVYGSLLRLSFVKRLRDERRFAGAAELVEQIRRDVEDARALLEL